jgi:hypothetical protein
MILNAGGMGTGGRWKDLKLNAAFHFPHPAFHEKRHEVPLVDEVREVGDYTAFSGRYRRGMTLSGYCEIKEAVLNYSNAVKYP